MRAVLDSVFRRGLASRNMSNDISNGALAVTNPTSSQGTYWLALALTAGLGPTRIRKLIEHFGNAERVFNASLTELEATGMRAVSAQSIATGKSLELAQEECRKAVEAGARIISLSDPEYPSRLKEIYDPPVILFVKGSVEVLAQPCLLYTSRRFNMIRLEIVLASVLILFAAVIFVFPGIPDKVPAWGAITFSALLLLNRYVVAPYKIRRVFRQSPNSRAPYRLAINEQNLRIVLPNSSEELRWEASVSYTHLDVYKRQACSCPEPSRES